MDVSGILRPPAADRVISELRLALAPSARNVDFALSGPRTEGGLDVADAPREDGDREWTLRLAHPVAPAQAKIHFCYSMDVDLARTHKPDPEKLFTWWSYRSPDWTKNNRGQQLGHTWATSDVAVTSQAEALHIHGPCRSWERPSDHVPWSPGSTLGPSS